MTQNRQRARAMAIGYVITDGFAELERTGADHWCLSGPDGAQLLTEAEAEDVLENVFPEDM